MSEKHLVRAGRRIIGFVWQDSKGDHWYAFGRPSQADYIAFKCRDKEHGIACIEVPTYYPNQTRVLSTQRAN